MSKPTRVELRPFAYLWIVCQSYAYGVYNTDDLKDYLAAVFKADRTRRLANGIGAFDNVVDWVVAEMTRAGWHEACGDDPKLRRLTTTGWSRLPIQV